MKKCRLWLTKEEIEPEILKGSTVVVIDVLLATTTLLTIIERGARRVFPVESIEDAKRLHEELGESSITGGEQRGLPIEGFTRGHLPEDYPAEYVKGKDVIFLTTNGTKAICRAKNADKVLIANLRNAPSVAKYLNTLEEEEVNIICAGSGGHFSLEDFLCASVIISEMNLDNAKYNDAVRIALEQRFDNKDKIYKALETSRVGRASLRKGMEELLRFTGDVGASNQIAFVQESELVVLR
ncbi:2-phosphosulfolactate phosphatase [Oceanobacillus sp. J11TS1]|uniref:2-phosphosulfolactate phosphatase n=1 Tax=Oceanobacillus sp. J11TS1 TaxID=2807191 RepID=UPI001B00A51B|nr:2-phosphosulfolactate phosphatase [Oceanobacillus sp. J11TS1]GIO22562.1 hypothetical protein J11TS1_11430 [Oceanobacillus sp. J11TS1]